MAATGTRVIYHIDGEKTPYGVKIHKPPTEVTLRDFKDALCKPQQQSFKYFFLSSDDNVGTVKEQYSSDSAKLPFINGRIECWLVRIEEPNYTNVTELAAQSGKSHTQSKQTLAYEAVGAVGDNKHCCETDSDTELSSFDGEASQDSSMHDMTIYTSVQEIKLRPKPHERRKKRVPSISEGSTCSSVNESISSVQLATVMIDMKTSHFLGISITELRCMDGERSIHVDSIVKGGAVALDGRIEVGDMLLQVNDVILQNVSKDDALRVLREAVQKPGPIKLIVAKCPDANEAGYTTIQRSARCNSVWTAHRHTGSIAPSTVAIKNNTAHPPSMVSNERSTAFMPVINRSVHSQNCATINESNFIKHSSLETSTYQRCNAESACSHLQTVNPIDTGEWVAQIPTATQEETISAQITALDINTNKRCDVPQPNAAGAEVYSTIQGGSAYSEPTRPIDPAAWVLHLEQVRANGAWDVQVKTDSLDEIVRAMSRPNSGLDIRDRLWLKMHIPNAFLGSDAINWIAKNVDSVKDKNEARAIAKKLLEGNYIRHAIDQNGKFSAKRYYSVNDDRHLPDCRSNFCGDDNQSVGTDIGTLPAPSNYVAYTGTYYPAHASVHARELNKCSELTARKSSSSKGSH